MRPDEYRSTRKKEEIETVLRYKFNSREMMHLCNGTPDDWAQLFLLGRCVSSRHAQLFHWHLTLLSTGNKSQYINSLYIFFFFCYCILVLIFVLFYLLFLPSIIIFIILDFRYHSLTFFLLSDLLFVLYTTHTQRHQTNTHSHTVLLNSLPSASISIAEFIELLHKVRLVNSYSELWPWSDVFGEYSRLLFMWVTLFNFSESFPKLVLYSNSELMCC